MKIKLLTHFFVTSSILSLLTITLSIQPSLACTLPLVSKSGLKTRMINQRFIPEERAKYIETEKFTESLAELAFIHNIKESKVYNYSLHTTQNSVFLHGILKEGVSELYFIRRKPSVLEFLYAITIGLFNPCYPPSMKKIPYKSYILAVFYTPDSKFQNIACQANKIGSVKLEEPFLQGDKLMCAEGSSVWQEVDLLQ